MDQYPGSGEGGAYEVSQGAAPAYVPAPESAPGFVPAPEPTAKKKPWIWIAGGAVLVVAIVLVLALGGGGGSGKAWVAPMLYSDDGDAFLAVGKESISLDDAAFAYGSDVLNAVVLQDGSAMFYLADVSEKSGEGSLMRIALGDAKAKPKVAAEDVFIAVLSRDGGKILYISDMEDGVGDLYLCTPGGDPAKVDESVEKFGISPNGKFVYYTVVDDGDETLYLYKGGKPAEVMDLKKDNSLNAAYVDNSGRMLFSIYDSDYTSSTLYLYSGGKAERISKNVEPFLAFDSATEFLYVKDSTELHYYNAGNEVRITKKLDRLRFPTIQNSSAEFDRHFVFLETASSGATTLYEHMLPSNTTKMLKVDGGYSISTDFRYIAYTDDGELCLARKAGRSWEDVQDVCDYSPQYAFDEGGRYLYYISADDGEYVGDLCRIPVSGGKEEVLMEDAVRFLLAGGKVYAINEDDEAYLVTNIKNSVKIEDDISGLYRAASGIYLTGLDGELYYYNGGKAERLTRDASTLDFSGDIIGGSY